MMRDVNYEVMIELHAKILIAWLICISGFGCITAQIRNQEDFVSVLNSNCSTKHRRIPLTKDVSVFFQIKDSKKSLS